LLNLVHGHALASTRPTFGGNEYSPQDIDMRIRSSNVYVPFFELPLEVHFLYWLGADSAMHELGTWFPTPGEFTAALACIWDSEQFSPADAADFLGMSKRLVPLLAHFAPKREAPLSAARKSRRKLRA